LPTRNTSAAKPFLDKALKGLKDWEKPLKINTYKAPTYGPAIAELEGRRMVIYGRSENLQQGPLAYGAAITATKLTNLTKLTKLTISHAGVSP